MKGQVLAYDDNSGVGQISGDDGNRYSFTRADLMQLVPIDRGTRVDFDFEGKQAKDIYLDIPSPAPERGNLDLHRLERRKVWAIRLLWVYFAATLFDFVSQALELLLLTQVQNGYGITIAAATANDQRQQFAALLYLGTFVLSGILSLMWTYRAAANSKALRADPPKISPGWAVGWYFVPVAWLWMPYRAMAEIWRRSMPDDSGARTSVLGWWWLLWLLSAFVGQVLLRLVLRANDLSSLLAGGWINLVGDVLDLLLILVYIRIVRTITHMQMDKAGLTQRRPQF